MTQFTVRVDNTQVTIYDDTFLAAARQAMRAMQKSAADQVEVVATSVVAGDEQIKKRIYHTCQNGLIGIQMHYESCQSERWPKRGGVYISSHYYYLVAQRKDPESGRSKGLVMEQFGSGQSNIHHVLPDVCIMLANHGWTEATFIDLSYRDTGIRSNVQRVIYDNVEFEDPREPIYDSCEEKGLPHPKLDRRHRGTDNNEDND